MSIKYDDDMSGYECKPIFHHTFFFQKKKVVFNPEEEEAFRKKTEAGIDIFRNGSDVLFPPLFVVVIYNTPVR